MNYLKYFLESTKNPHDHPATIGYLANLDLLSKQNPVIAQGIIEELKAQRNSLKMIASENYCSLTVQLAMGNLLTDKYAEGHVGHRFYAGCEFVDMIEQEAIDNAKKLFNAKHAYVQPHSGVDANLIACWAILIKRCETPKIEALGKKSAVDLTPDEYETIRKTFSMQKMLGLALDAGGHLSHGSRVNISSKMMQAISYTVDHKTGLIDYKELESIALRERPAILMAGHSAYPRLLNFAKMREIADKSGATLVVDMAHFAGLVAGKQLTGDHDPIPFAHVVTSTTHKTLRGPRGGLILSDEAHSSYIDRGCPIAQGGPAPHIMAAKAVCFKEALDPSFQTYAKQIIHNAKCLASYFKEKGVTLTTGGTDNHLMVLNVAKSFGLTGRQAETALTSIGISLNRNTIPGDPNGAWYCSGIRLGTPALTTRGLKELEMEKIGAIIYETLKNTKPDLDPKTGKPSLAKASTEPTLIESMQEQVASLLENFPLYPEIEIPSEIKSKF